LLKTGFFRQVRELKIQRKNPGNALSGEKNVDYIFLLFAPLFWSFIRLWL